MAQYDGSEVSVIWNGQRIEQVQSVSTPDESYDREYERTLGDDEDVLLMDNEPELEGEVVVAPTSGSIENLDQDLREGTESTLTIRFPPDHTKTSETFTGAVLTEGSDDDFDGDGTTNRTYTFIAGDIE